MDFGVPTPETPVTRDTVRYSRNRRQREINYQVARLFGARFLTLRNRVERLIEEVAELAQAEDFPLEDALRIVQLAYAAPKGDPDQEAGGVSVCLLSYCEVKGRSADHLERRELDRLATKNPEELAEKLKAKIASGIVTDELAA
ncbi:hypothetical protein [Methylorubrum extorquens]|uniref:hypothetical protein n=1 Tax=Methylorubrum extorquens TaxID=408 RepID=UPI00209C7B0D|nr:hypothetical protein [Methylorubrum extorquens]MCP1540123.1 hypothetical protein [Methylorubrum extorquens]